MSADRQPRRVTTEEGGDRACCSFRDATAAFTAGKYRSVLDTIKEFDGFVSAYRLVDPETEDSISISMFASEDAARERSR